MCDALRGLLTGFVLRLRGAHSRCWDVRNLSQVSGSFWPYLTFEQGTAGNYFLKIKREHIARVSAFFAAPSNRATVTWEPSIFSWYRLSFSESNQPGALAIPNYADSAIREALLRQSQDCRASLLALSGEISGLHGSPGLVHSPAWTH